MTGWQPLVVPALSGAAGRARVTFRGAAFRHDPATGRRRFPAEGDFEPALIAEIYERQPCFLERRGWFQRRTHCRRCRGAVAPAPPTPHTFELRIGELYRPFTLAIEVPALRCARCNTWNALPASELADDINEAMIAAFKSEGITR